MINVKELMKAKRIVITYIDMEDVDKEFVKRFRAQFDLTQVALANIMNVSKKTVEKWEQGVNNINGSSAVLFALIKENPELILKLRQVKVVNEDGAEEEFRTIATNSYSLQIPQETKESYSVTKCRGEDFRLVLSGAY